MRRSIKVSLEADLGEAVTGSGGVAVTESGRRLFVKSGTASRTYRCEARGLEELARAGAVRVAKAVSVGDDYIATEYILPGSPSGDFFDRFGRELARMHRHSAPSFGFREDNFIGGNFQVNLPEGSEKDDWPSFYFNKRLLYQYRLAESNGYAGCLKEGFLKLESLIPGILAGSGEPPALLHGDLWAGNYICDGSSNEAVLIDPAVYYGHREADLAMTKLFGGFPRGFYDGYMREYPLKSGWEYREPLYRLYHVLNHLNLFGRSYFPEAEAIINFYTK